MSTKASYQPAGANDEIKKQVCNENGTLGTHIDNGKVYIN